MARKSFRLVEIGNAGHDYGVSAVQGDSRHGSFEYNDFTSGATLQIRTSYTALAREPVQISHMALTSHRARRHQMRRPRLYGWSACDTVNWLKSFEHCLFCRW